MDNIQPRIYVVEDNPMYQALIVKQLENISEDIHIYSSGEAMLEDLYYPPELVVLDYNLDGDMNGYDVLHALRSSGFTMHVILFSTNPAVTVSSSGTEPAFTTCIVKTITAMPQLQQMVLSLIDKITANLEKIY